MVHYAILAMRSAAWKTCMHSLFDKSYTIWHVFFAKIVDFCRKMC